MNESDRRFHVEQERLRDKHKFAERAKRRAAHAIQREQALQRAFSTTPQVQMCITEWVTDELGNLSRMIYAEPKRKKAAGDIVGGE